MTQQLLKQALVSMKGILESNQMTAESDDIKIGREFQSLRRKDAENSDEVSSEEHFIIQIAEVNFGEEIAITPSKSSSLFAPSFFYDLKTIPNTCAYVYPIASSFISLKDWVTIHRELLRCPLVSKPLEQALKVIDAVMNMHEAQPHQFLVDLSISHSIWIEKDGSVKLLAKQKKNSPRLDKEIIYENYLDQLRDISVSLYPPEMLDASLESDRQTAVIRDQLNDSWAIGVVLLLMLRCSYSDIPKQTINFDFHKNLNYKNKSQSSNLVHALFTAIFTKSWLKRLSLKEIKLMINRILLSENEIDDRKDEIKKRVIDPEDISIIKDYLSEFNQKLNRSSTLSKEEFSLFREQLKEKIRTNPSDSGSTLLLARLLSLQKMNKAAAFQYERLKKLTPSCSDLHYDLGLLAVQEVRYDDALSHFQRCTAGHVSQMNVHAEFQIAEIQTIRGNYILAISSYKECLKHDKTNPLFLSRLANALAHDDRHLVASSHMKEIMHLRKDYRDLHELYAQHHYELQRKTLQQRAMSQEQLFEQHMYLGKAIQALGKYEEAIVSFKKSYSLQKTSNLWSVLGLSECYLELKNITEALNHLNVLMSMLQEKNAAKSSDLLKRGYLALARVQSIRFHFNDSFIAYKKCFNSMESNDPTKGSIIAEFLIMQKAYFDIHLQISVRKNRLELKHDIGYQFAYDIWNQAALLDEKYRQVLVLSESGELQGKVDDVIRCFAYRYVASGQPHRALTLFNICLEIGPKSVHTIFDSITAACMQNSSTDWTKKEAKYNRKEWDKFLEGSTMKGTGISSLQMLSAALHTERFVVSNDLKMKRLINMAQIPFETPEEETQWGNDAHSLEKNNPDYWLIVLQRCLQNQKDKIDEEQCIAAAKQCLILYPYHIPMLRLLLHTYDRNGYSKVMAEEKLRQQLNEAECINQAMFNLLRGCPKTATRQLFACNRINSNNELIRLLAFLPSPQEYLNDFCKELRNTSNEQLALNDVFDLLLKQVRVAQKDSIQSDSYTTGAREWFKQLFDNPNAAEFAKITNLHSILQNNQSQKSGSVEEQENHKGDDPNKNLEEGDQFETEKEKEDRLLKTNFILAFTQAYILTGQAQSEANERINAIKNTIQLYEELCLQVDVSSTFKSIATFLCAEVSYMAGSIKESRELLAKCDSHSEAGLSTSMRLMSILLDIEQENSSIEQLLVVAVQSANEITNQLFLPRIGECVLNKFGHVNCKGFCMYQTAVALKEKKKYQKAIHAVQLVIDANPQFNALKMLFIELLVLSERYSEARIALEQVEGEKPTSLVGFKGLVLSKNKEWSTAVLVMIEYLKREATENHLIGIDDTSESVLIDPIYEKKDLSQLTQQVVGELAFVYENLGRLDESLAVLHNIVKQQPLDLKTWLSISRVLHKLGRELESAQALKQCSEIDSQDARSLLELGLLFKANEKYSQAIAILKKCLKLEQNHPTAYGLIGDCYVAQNATDSDAAAEMKYREQIHITKENTDCFYSLGLLLAKKGSKTEAYDVFMEGIKYVSQKEKKLCFYEQIILISESGVPLTRSFVFILKNYSEDFPEKSKENLNRAAHFYQYRLGDAAEAVKYYESYLECSKEDAATESFVIIQFKAACLYLIQQSPFKAETHLLATLKMQPTMYESHFKLAQAYLQMNNSEKALTHLELGLSMYPTNPSGLLDLGYILMKNKQYEAALPVLEDCMHYSDGRLPKIYEVLGTVYKKLRMFDEAIIVYKESLKREPDNHKIMISLASVLFVKKQYKEILEIFAAWNGGNKSPKKCYIHGEAYLNEQMYEQANVQYANVILLKNVKYSVLSYLRIFRKKIADGQCSQLYEGLMKALLSAEKKSENTIAILNYIQAELHLYWGYLDSAVQLIQKTKESPTPFSLIFLSDARYQLYLSKNPREAQKLLELCAKDEEVRDSIEFRLLSCEINFELKDESLFYELISSNKTEQYDSWVKPELEYYAAIIQRKDSSGDPTETLYDNASHLKSLILLSQILVDQGKLEEAKKKLLERKAALQENTNWLNEIGRVMSLMKDYKQALSYYERSFNYYKNNADVCIAYARHLYLDNQIEKAESILLKHCFVFDTVLPETFLVYAEVLILLGSVKRAITMAECYNEKMPTCEKGYVVLGNAYDLLDERAEARQAYEEGYRKNAANQILLMKLGSIYYTLKEIEALRRVISDIDGCSFSTDPDISFQLAIWASLVGDFTKAEIYMSGLDWLREKDKNYLSHHLNISFELGKHDQIKSEMDQLFKSNQSRLVEGSFVLWKIANHMYQQGEFVNSIYWLKKTKPATTLEAIERNLKISKAAFQTKKYQVAQKQINFILKRICQIACPIEVKQDFLYMKAIVGMAIGIAFEESISHLKELLAIEKSPRVYSRLGIIYWKQGSPTRKVLAKTMLEEAVKANEGEEIEEVTLLRTMIDVDEGIINLEEIKSSILEQLKTTKSADSQLKNQLLQIYIKMGNFKKSIMFCQKVIQSQSNKPISLNTIPLVKKEIQSIHFQQAVVEKEAGLIKDAISTMKAYIIQYSFTAEGSSFLAKLYEQSLNFSDATYVLKQLAYQADVKEDCLVQLAEILLKQSCFDECISTLRRCLDLFPDSKKASAMLAIMKHKTNTIRELMYLKNAYRIDPSNIEVQEELMHSMVRFNELDEFDAVFKRYSAANPVYKPSIILLLAKKTLKSNNRIEEVKALLTDGTAKHPEDIPLHLQLAEIYQQQNDYKKSATIYNQILTSLSPTLDEKMSIQKMLAHCLMCCGEFTAAEKILQELTAELSQPTTPECVQNLGLCYVAQNKCADAIVLLKKACAKFPYDERSHFLLAYAYAEENNKEAAIQFYQRCIDIQPGFMEAAINISIIYKSLKRYKDAELFLVEMQQFYPKHLTPAYHLALVYLAQGKYSEAVSLLQERLQDPVNAAIEDDKTVDKREEFIRVFKTTKNSSSIHGKTVLDRIRYGNQYSPDLITINLLLAHSLKVSGQINQSILHLQSCIAKEPNNALYTYCLAVTYFQEGQKDKALFYINTSKLINQDDEVAYLLAWSCMVHTLGLAEKEIELLQQCLGKDESMYEVLTNLGCAYYSKKEFSQAGVLFRKAIAIRPWDANAHYNLGNVLMVNRDFTGAIESYSECLKYNVRHEDCLINLGFVYESKHEIGKAMKCLENCLEINPIRSDFVSQKLMRLQNKAILENK